MDTKAEASLRIVAAALLTCILGGLVALLGEGFDNSTVAAVGLVTCLAGALAAGGGAVADARRTDRSYVGSIWLGARTAVRWLFHFL